MDQNHQNHQKYGHFVRTVAICGEIEVNDNCLETFEFFESVFKPHVRL